MEHAKELLSAPLSALAASLFSVRRYASGQVEELAALIDSQGLLHNLVVTEQLARRGRRGGSCRFRCDPRQDDTVTIRCATADRANHRAAAASKRDHVARIRARTAA
jgi:hypothetical protein